MQKRLLLFILVLCLACPGAAARRPFVWLWAWQRPENLEFINPSEVGVAYLAQTIRLSGGSVINEPRVQPLRVPAGTRTIAVSRIHVDARAGALMSDAQLQKVERLILQTATPKVESIQIDFDARVSERPFYRRLLASLHADLPPGEQLSVTALSSWATFDNWLAGAPVDQIVPMFFSMGADKRNVLIFLDEGRSLLPGTASAIGVSVDDAQTARAVLQSKAAAGRSSTFFFSSKPWTRARLVGWASVF